MKNLTLFCLLFFSSFPDASAQSRKETVVPRVPIEYQAEGRQFEVLHDSARFPGSGDPRYLRSLETFYQRRQYPGSPPFIPHPVEGKMFENSSNCGSCHNKGGFVRKWSAYAPVTPHPERVSCRQCHVPLKTAKLFKGNNWRGAKPPAIKQTAISGGPPGIPLSLEDRGSCLSCHGGPSAIRGIKTSHPERVHCRQCHVSLLGL